MGRKPRIGQRDRSHVDQGRNGFRSRCSAAGPAPASPGFRASPNRSVRAGRSSRPIRRSGYGRSSRSPARSRQVGLAAQTPPKASSSGQTPPPPARTNAPGRPAPLVGAAVH
jgi:hypothetical protein